MPLAPGRFSTITCCPRCSDIFGAMRRDMMSVVLPGGNGMMMRIGLDGYKEDGCCAYAAQQTAKMSTPSRCFMAILLAMILRALAAAAALVSTAAAQDYPSKPIRIL